MIDNLSKDIYLFQNDLVEYQNSIQGKLIIEELEKLENNILNAEKLEKLLNDYWTARDKNKFDYYNENDKIEGIKQDTFISSLYHEQN